jgi:hypothetical protein
MYELYALYLMLYLSRTRLYVTHASKEDDEDQHCAPSLADTYSYVVISRAQSCRHLPLCRDHFICSL